MMEKNQEIVQSGSVNEAESTGGNSGCMDNYDGGAAYLHCRNKNNGT